MKKVLNILAITLVCLGIMACSQKKDNGAENETDIKIKKVETTAPGKLTKIIDFSATWCPPCQELKPIYEELAEEYKGKVEMISIDVDENGEMAEEYNIEAVPTLVYFNEKGEVIYRTEGFLKKKDLKNNIESLLTN